MLNKWRSIWYVEGYQKLIPNTWPYASIRHDSELLGEIVCSWLDDHENTIQSRKMTMSYTSISLICKYNMPSMTSTYPKVPYQEIFKLCSCNWCQNFWLQVLCSCSQLCLGWSASVEIQESYGTYDHGKPKRDERKIDTSQTTALPADVYMHQNIIRCTTREKETILGPCKALKITAPILRGIVSRLDNRVKYSPTVWALRPSYILTVFSESTPTSAV